MTEHFWLLALKIMQSSQINLILNNHFPAQEGLDEEKDIKVTPLIYYLSQDIPEHELRGRLICKN